MVSFGPKETRVSSSDPLWRDQLWLLQQVGKGSVTYAQLPRAVETAAAVSEATKERLCATFKLDMQKNVPFKEAL